MYILYMYVHMYLPTHTYNIYMIHICTIHFIYCFGKHLLFNSLSLCNRLLRLCNSISTRTMFGSRRTIYNMNSEIVLIVAGAYH